MKYSREALHKSGVYALKYRGRVIYVGGSKRCIHNRFCHHKDMLSSKRHGSKRLQKLWNETKGKYWTGVVLELCAKKDVHSKEIHWATLYSKTLLSAKVAGQKFKMSAKTREKMKASAIRIASDPEERKRRSDRAKRQHAEGRLGPSTWPAGTGEKIGKKTSVTMRAFMAAHPENLAKMVGDSAEMSRRSYQRRIFREA